jgi:hypothetical protein
VQTYFIVKPLDPIHDIKSCLISRGVLQSAKYAAAFFRISLSTLAEANSRRNRSTSASSPFADRGVAVTPADDPSLPARSSLAQLNKLESGIPSRRLASDIPTLCPSFTASILNSFVLGTPTFL